MCVYYVYVTYAWIDMTTNAAELKNYEKLSF